MNLLNFVSESVYDITKYRGITISKPLTCTQRFYRIIRMCRKILTLYLLFLSICLSGCDLLNLKSSHKNSEDLNRDYIEGIQFSDLQASHQVDPMNMNLVSLRVLTYVIDAESVSLVADMFDRLSRKEMTYTNEAAFHANGFSAGGGSPKKGAEIVQKLNEIGAVRAKQGMLNILPDTPEIFTSTYIQGAQSVLYSTSATGLGGADIEEGFLGWVITPRQDAKQRSILHLKLEPAFWHIGGMAIRMSGGQNIFNFRPFDVGRVIAGMEEGGFLILGPNREITNQPTLDKYLFYLPGKKPQIQFFVIICESAGS